MNDPKQRRINTSVQQIFCVFTATWIRYVIRDAFLITMIVCSSLTRDMYIGTSAFFCVVLSCVCTALPRADPPSKEPYKNI